MMGIVHSALRRDLVRARLVLAEPTPLTGERRTALADHVRWLMDFLHHHHTNEDEGLYPLVLEKNPAAGDLLAVMDAENLSFPDGSFDVIVAQYVITTVPNPEAALNEFARVLKPGGEIILVNHLGAESGFRWAFEQGFSPIARRLGWSPEFPWDRLVRWAERDGVRLIERRPMPPMGHFSLIRFGKAA